MNREEILAKAQKGTDERELVIKTKAYKYASEVSTTIGAFIALFLVVDGYILEHVRTFSGMDVGMLLVGVYTLYFAVYEGYRGFQLKDKVGILGCAVMTIIAATFLKMFLGIIL